MEENSSQQFGNLISQQTNNLKTLLPPSAVIDNEITFFRNLLLFCLAY